MSRKGTSLLAVVTIAAVLAGAPQCVPAQAPTGTEPTVTESTATEAVPAEASALKAASTGQLCDVLTMDALSSALWPGWDISATVSESLSPMPEGSLPFAFQTAFSAYQSEQCPEMAERLDFGAGFLSIPRNLVLVDIECELLAAALAAPAESLDAIVRDFVRVRGFRRAGITGRFVDYERHREHITGTATYIGIACSAAAPLGTYECTVDLFKAARDIDWYKGMRFRCTGAAICLLLDRIEPGWKTAVSERCIDPYAVLWDRFSGGSPNVTRLLERHGFASREEAAVAFIDQTKSGPERLFEEITQREETLFIINTKQLVSTTVSYDRESIAEVDTHRAVHKRILKIEYSGGSHVYIAGRPTAVVLGQNEFDFQQLILEAPDKYTITVGGEPFTPVYGINHLNGVLSVLAPGVDIEVQDAVIVLANDRISFLLHR